jgi:hypothetical protein
VAQQPKERFMTTIDTAETKKPIDLETLILAHGAHKRASDGMCLLEAVSYIAGEKFSDRPACVDPALGAYGRAFNDRLNAEERQLLKPLVTKLVGTKGSLDLMRRRAFLLVDRHLRVNLPAFFRGLPHKPRPDLSVRLEGLHSPKRSS